jgi:hypothetical protein
MVVARKEPITRNRAVSLSLDCHRYVDSLFAHLQVAAGTAARSHPGDSHLVEDNRLAEDNPAAVDNPAARAGEPHIDPGEDIGLAEAEDIGRVVGVDILVADIRLGAAADIAAGRLEEGRILAVVAAGTGPEEGILEQDTVVVVALW